MSQLTAWSLVTVPRSSARDATLLPRVLLLTVSNSSVGEFPSRSDRTQCAPLKTYDGPGSCSVSVTFVLAACHLKLADPSWPFASDAVVPAPVAGAVHVTVLLVSASNVNADVALTAAPPSAGCSHLVTLMVEPHS